MELQNELLRELWVIIKSDKILNILLQTKLSLKHIFWVYRLSKTYVLFHLLGFSNNILQMKFWIFSEKKIFIYLFFLKDFWFAHGRYPHLNFSRGERCFMTFSSQFYRLDNPHLNPESFNFACAWILKGSIDFLVILRNYIELLFMYL